MRRYHWIKWRTFILWLAALVIIGVLLWAGGPTAWAGRIEYCQHFAAVALCHDVHDHPVRSSFLVPGPGTHVLDSAWRDRLHLG